MMNQHTPLDRDAPPVGRVIKPPDRLPLPESAPVQTGSLSPSAETPADPPVHAAGVPDTLPQPQPPAPPMPLPQPPAPDALSAPLPQPPAPLVSLPQPPILQTPPPPLPLPEEVKTELLPRGQEPPVPQAAEPPADAEKELPEAKPLSNEAVTGHTAALWKYNPIPQDQPEPFPEYLTACREYPGGRLTGARVRGKKHKHEGTNCDDWFAVSSFQDLLFIVVSDGAGSRKFSRIGARESCRAAAGYLAKRFSELWTPSLIPELALDLQDERCMKACGLLAGAVQQSVLKARDAVEAAFYTRSTDPAYESVLGRPLDFKDLSGTLLAAAVIPAGSAGKLVISCQVGDGMIALIDSKAPFASSLKLMGVPDSGEFSGETEFLTSAKMASLDALQNRTKISRGHSDLLLVMTDGVADDYFPNETEMRRLYFDLLANGILPWEAGSLSAEQLRIYKTLPAPLSYPWVNDQSVQVPLHYTRRILEAGTLTPELLWENRAVLALARQELEGQTALDDPAERLKRWLDNYVERGSFDDRTLVAVEIKEA